MAVDYWGQQRGFGWRCAEVTGDHNHTCSTSMEGEVSVGFGLIPPGPRCLLVWGAGATPRDAPRDDLRSGGCVGGA